MLVYIAVAPVCSYVWGIVFIEGAVLACAGV